MQCNKFVNAPKLKKIKSEVRGNPLVVRKLRRGKIVCFEVTFEGVKWCRYFNCGKYMILDLMSSRGESTTSEIGFYPGHLEDRLTGGTQRTTGLMVRYEVVKVSRLLGRKDL